MLGVGASKKTYLDDVFSVDFYDANQGNYITVNNGIDLSAEGGLVWGKRRDYAEDHVLCDTERGTLKYLAANSTAAAVTDHGFSSYNSNGFTVNNASRGAVNQSSGNYVTSTFRKAKGFLDIITWDGNGSGSSTRTLSHSLGSIPGMVIIKRTDGASNWWVYHKSLAENKILYLSETNGQDTGGYSYYQSVSSTGLTVGTELNESGRSYVAYIFAGGESGAATARSIGFNGVNTYLSIPDSTDFNLGTNSFTIEGWIHPEAGSMSSGYYGMICGQTSDNWYITVRGGSGLNSIQYYDGVSAHNSAPNSIPEGQWTHFAFVNNSGTGTWYINGVKSTDSASVSAPNIPNSSGAFEIGRNNSSNYLKGDISNLRIVKGTAVYTSSFRPPTEPLTNITNTVLLCCNDSSATGSTVTPGTITATGNEPTRTYSPFDDPAGFKFGENKEGIIKCGYYVGNGSSSAPPKIYLGWEPQWVMVKRINGSGQDWVMVDTMRGMFSGLSQTPHLRANATNAEADTSYYRIDVSSSTGFAPFTTDNGLNGNGDEYIYIALRRPDGYVGKPAEAGTDVFAMDTGYTAGSHRPSFDSGFPVDFGFTKMPASSSHWLSGSRITGSNGMNLNQTNAESGAGNMIWDENAGFWDYSSGSTEQAWMWKRHAGFDVVTYDGRQGGATVMEIKHNLGVVPEMIMIKKRNNNGMWAIYHKGVNGGTNPEQYMMQIDANAQEDQPTFMNDTAPTATVFTVGSMSSVNDSGDDYIAYLFSSIDGISKVGSYTGNGSATARTITLGFQPRFLIVKRTDDTNAWVVFDTTRTWGSGNDYHLSLNTISAQVESQDIGAPTSTGFTLNTSLANYNANNSPYIYYAHA